MPILSIPRCAVFVVLLSLLTGCGGGTKVTQVTGRVTLADGAVPTGVYVMFLDDVNKRSPSGIVGADGRYTLTTDKPDDGAPPGVYKISFAPPSPADSNDPTPPTPFHDKYLSVSTSGLEREVKPGQTNEFDFVLDPPAR
jgi:hypothetical protein